MTNILVINGHPIKKSFCSSIAKEYVKGAKKSKAKIKILNLNKIKFNPIFSDKKQALEKSLKDVQKQIKLADHLVFVYPIWWGDMPALLKGFFERTFTPGFAYDPKHKTKGMPKSLLDGKTARLIITMGAPNIFYKIKGQSATKIMKFNLKYCGIRPVKATHFYRMDSRSINHKSILSKINELGRGFK